MKNRLLILSDLWGIEKSEWITHYTERLQDNFEIQYYDSCALAMINKTPYTEENLHKQFVHGGIEKAVQNLALLETGESSILAFSIGGTIAWKYGIQTGNIKTLHSISATRLRQESNKPKGKITLYYGEQDPYKPDITWFDKMQLDPHILAHKQHDLYIESNFSEVLCKQLQTDIHSIL